MTQNWLIHVIRRPARKEDDYYYSSPYIFTLSDPGKRIPTCGSIRFTSSSIKQPPPPRKSRGKTSMFNRCYALETTDSLNCTTRLSMNVLFMIMRINAESISNNGLQNLLCPSLLHIYRLFSFFLPPFRSVSFQIMHTNCIHHHLKVWDLFDEKETWIFS